MSFLPVVLTVGVSETMAARLRHAMRMQRDFRLFEAQSDTEAIELMPVIVPGVVMINTRLASGCPLSVADFAGYRYPKTRIIYEIGAGRGFEDGSLFAHSSNAHLLVTQSMETTDLGAMVVHHAQAGPDLRACA